MGRATDKIVSRAAMVKKQKVGLDGWLLRGAHISQLLFLLLGIFGYFYTVRPLYQKELLDEEIAQKRVEIRDKERQAARLSEEIERRNLEVREKERLLGSARTEARVARTEAEQTYNELRDRYASDVFHPFRDCGAIAWDRSLDGGELKRCPKFVSDSQSYQLEKLKPRDSKRLLNLVNEGVKKAQPEFDAVVTAQQRQLLKSSEEIALLRAEIDSEEHKAASPSNRLKAVLRMGQLNLDEQKIRIDTHQELRKILDRIASKLNMVFLESNSS